MRRPLWFSLIVAAVLSAWPAAPACADGPYGVRAGEVPNPGAPYRPYYRGTYRNGPSNRLNYLDFHHAYPPGWYTYHTMFDPFTPRGATEIEQGPARW
jgi:hypothetical protein